MTRRPITQAPAGAVRVAIYCRQSVEDSTSAFGSMEAQRQAIEAYVTSQRGEGWVALSERYDDSGFSGKNIERPAFKRLLADVEAGRIDVVAVYRIDRFSRSLLDFVRLMEAFRAKGVTCCSVTEHFSTTSPSGRMTLNLLATFAEYEREVISQRTKDKIGAARRRGMWTGGRPCLGYDVKDKKLVVNPAEAEQVRAIFKLYLDLGTLSATLAELARRGWRTKSWTNQEGKFVHGRTFDRSALQKLLRRRVLTGMQVLGRETFAGQHDAIVDEGLWDAVQVQLSRHARRGGAEGKNKHGVLLRGILACAICDSPMKHTFSGRNGRQSVYYVCSKADKQGAAACPRSRISVHQIEGFVVERIREIGRDPDLVRESIAAAKAECVAKTPELIATIRSHEVEARRLTEERRNLVDAVAKGGAGSGALMRRVGEVDDLIAAAEERAREARIELVRVEGQVIDEDEFRAAMESFDPVWAELFPRERARVLGLLLSRVTYDTRTRTVAITFRPGGVRILRASA